MSLRKAILAVAAALPGAAVADSASADSNQPMPSSVAPVVGRPVAVPAGRPPPASATVQLHQGKQRFMPTVFTGPVLYYHSPPPGYRAPPPPVPSGWSVPPGWQFCPALNASYPLHVPCPY